ncbi:SDR family oxidoreductase [Shewanella aestuarii]|uniref:SDR family oxidoreductase n=2 Tax=Shewanella aestuarii TaxID=1028752 RepID=A0A6G9QQN0_9GAMM|nr:SDR family oxidoreductase [Shewanella aestuarii]
MMKLLQDKHILITGSSRGIGKAIAELFASHGATLYLNGTNVERLEKLKQTITDEYQTECHIIPFDVSNSDAVKNGFKSLFSLTKRLDVLVNNAGILSSSLLRMIDSKQTEQQFATNAYSIIYCCQYASRLMQKSTHASIINMSSIMGGVGSEGHIAYSGSKAAVNGITKSLAKELADKHIRVNAIAPGFIDTDMTRNISEDKYQQRINSIAMGYAGQPEDVANTALFLASDMSKYITGQVIGVDGGMLI